MKTSKVIITNKIVIIVTMVVKIEVVTNEKLKRRSYSVKYNCGHGKTMPLTINS